MSNGGDFDIDCKQEEWEKRQRAEAGFKDDCEDDGDVALVCHICNSLDGLKECNECHQHACPEHWGEEDCCSKCSDEYHGCDY